MITSLNRFLRVLVALVLCSFAHLSFAQISPSSVSGSYTGLDHINRIIRGTPGVTTTSVTGGAVDAAASGSVNVNRGGLNIPVPTVIKGKVGAAAIASGAARIGLRMLPWVGAGLALKEITDAAVKDGWKVCPPPAFFCRPDWDQPDPNYFWYENMTSNMIAARPTAKETCLAAIPINWSTFTFSRLVQVTPSQVSCYGINAAGTEMRLTQNIYRGSCGNTTWPYSGCSVVNPPKPDIPATEPDLAGSMSKEQNSKPGFGKTLYDHMKTMEQQNPSLPQVIPNSDIPITMDAAPVVFPATQVSTQTEPNSDGNGTKTTTVKEQVTVTPTVGTPATLDKPSITYPTTVTTTTTVVNNVTNVTNITTQVTKHEPANQEKPEPLPKDYNREATQLKILEQLDGSTVTNTPANPTIKEDMKKVQDDIGKGFTDLPPTIEESKGNWFSWVWSPTIGQCDESNYQGTVRGYAVNIGVCELVDKFRDLLGFLWAVIGACSIYSQLFKKGES